MSFYFASLQLLYFIARVRRRARNVFRERERPRDEGETLSARDRAILGTIERQGQQMLDIQREQMSLMNNLLTMFTSTAPSTLTHPPLQPHPPPQHFTQSYPPQQHFSQFYPPAQHFSQSPPPPQVFSQLMLDSHDYTKD